MKLLDSMQEAGTAVKCLITLAAVLAALLIGGIFIAILRVDLWRPIITFWYGPSAPLEALEKFP